MPQDIFISAMLDIGVDPTKTMGQLNKLATEVKRKLKAIEGQTNLKIGTVDPSKIKDAVSGLRSLGNVAKKFSDVNIANGLFAITQALQKLSSLSLNIPTGSFAGIAELAKGLKSLTRIKTGELDTITGSLRKFAQDFTFPIKDEEVARVERMANALAKLKSSLPTVRQFKTQQGIASSLGQQEGAVKKLTVMERIRNAVLRKGYEVVVSTVSMIGRQVAYSVIWSTIYGTIYRVNQLLRDGVNMFQELEEGAAKALRTGLSLEQVAKAFTNRPERRGTGDIGGMADIVKQYRELISLQAISFTSKHQSQLQDYTGAVYELASANIDLKNALDFADISAKTAIATESDIEEVTRSLAGVYNIFKDTIVDAGTEQEKFAQIADVVTYTWSKEQIELDELNNALKYSGNLTRLLGVDYRELITIVGHLNTNLVRSSTAGTGIRQVFNALGKDLPKVSQLFNEVKSAVEGIEGPLPDVFDPDKPLDFIGILEVLHGRLSAMNMELHGTAEISKITTGQIGELLSAFKIRGGNIIAVLIKDFPILKKKIEDVKKATSGYVDQLVKIQELNFSTQIEILAKNLKSLSTSFVLGLTGSTEMIMSIAGLNERLGDLQIILYKVGKSFSNSWGGVIEMLDSGDETIKNVVLEFLDWGKRLGDTVIGIGRLIISLQPLLEVLNIIAKVVLSLGNIVIGLASIVGTSIGVIVDMFSLYHQAVIRTDVQSAKFYEKTLLYGSALKDLLSGKTINTNQFLAQLKSIDDGFSDSMNNIKKDYGSFLKNVEVGAKSTYGGAVKSIIDSGADIVDVLSGTENNLFDLYDGTIDQDVFDNLLNLSQGHVKAQKALEEYKEAVVSGHYEINKSSKTFVADSILQTQAMTKMFETSNKGIGHIHSFILAMNTWNMSLEEANKQENPFIKQTQGFSDLVTVWRTQINETMDVVTMSEQAIDEAMDTKNVFAMGVATVKSAQAWIYYRETAMRNLDLFKKGLADTMLEIEKSMGIAFADLNPEEREVELLKTDHSAEMKKYREFLKVRQKEYLLTDDEVKKKIEILEEKHQGEIQDIRDKYSKERDDKEKAFTDFFLDENAKKRQGIIDNHNEMLAEHEGNAEKQLQIKQHLAEALKEFDDDIINQEVEAREDAAEEKLKTEQKLQDTLKQLRDEGLKDIQAKAQVELDIDKQKQINILKQKQAAELAGVTNPDEVERINAKYEAAIAQLEAEYGIKDALLAQQQAQERINNLLEQRKTVMKDMRGLSGDELKKKQNELNGIDLLIAQEQLTIEKAKENALDSQLDIQEKQLETKTSQVGLDREASGIIDFITSKLPGNDSTSSGTNIGLTPQGSTLTNNFNALQGPGKSTGNDGYKIPAVTQMMESVAKATQNTTGLSGVDVSLPSNTIQIPPYGGIKPDFNNLGVGQSLSDFQSSTAIPEYDKRSTEGVTLNVTVNGDDVSGDALSGSFKNAIKEFGESVMDNIRITGGGF